MSQISEAEVRLPRPPGVIRRALAAHPLIVDVFIVVWYFIGCSLALLFDFAYASSTAALSDSAADPASTGIGLTLQDIQLPAYLALPWWPLWLLRMLAVAAALLYRRRFPLAGLIVTTIALFGDHSAQSMPNSVALLFLIYAVPVYRSVSAGWVGYGIALGGSLLLSFLERSWPAVIGAIGPAGLVAADTSTMPATLPLSLTVSMMTAVWYLAVLMVGINIGNRRRYVSAIIDRAHQLVRERDQRAQLAVAEERSRIAREMHDIVAHSVSVMIALSEGASRAVSTAPTAAADAMQRSAETGRTALMEMRRMLGALNDPRESAELAPQPGIDELPELAQSFREAGLDVALRLTGGSTGDGSRDLAVYRIVQEGLTNVLRYAGTGARVDVSIACERERVGIEIRDHGPVSGERPLTGLGSGRGLAGLAERVRMFGGSLEFGPVPVQAGGGWRLSAVLTAGSATRSSDDAIRLDGTGRMEIEGEGNG